MMKLLSPTQARDERGVALPLALLGLIAVSLLVTSALLSSSTESAISGAQRDAAAGLYRADAALEGYVASRAALLNPSPDDPRFAEAATPATYTQEGQSYAISTARLAYNAWTLNSTTVAEDSATETWALTAAPSNGLGRSVSALLTVVRTFPRFAANIESGMLSGGQVNVKGTSTISDGSDSNICQLASGQNSLVVTSEGGITVSGTSQVVGATDTASYSKTDIVSRILGGMELDSLAKYATIKFAAGQFNGTGISTSATDSKYNWGCPTNVGITCNPLTAAKDTAYYPVIAIDAGGGEVSINGDYGQGTLIVRNGSLRIQGNFVFKGLVFVDGDFTIAGTGSGTGKIEGSVIAMGTNSIDADMVTGNATIRFNRCSVIEAQKAFNREGLKKAPQQVNAATYSWFEVIR